jgi:hypothetical protein
MQKHSPSSIIKGYHGQLIKQSQITVRGWQSIGLKPCKVDLNKRSGAPTELTPTRRFGLGSKLTVSGTRLSDMPHTVYPASHMYPPPGCKAADDYSRVVRKSSRTVSLSLTHESHWTGAQIPCSYHMSNPFIKILWLQHKNLFSRVTNITRLLPGPIA